MAEQYICDLRLPEYGDVDQRRITKFIDGVDIRAMLGEKRDAFREAFVRVASALTIGAPGAR